MNLLTRYGILAQFGIPNGSTVTPLNDKDIWLACAELSSGLSLASVLADGILMTALSNSNNAVNYMVRSTGVIMTDVVASSNAMTKLDLSSYAVSEMFKNSTWYSAIVGSATAVTVLDATAIKVPTMTSNTVPSGIAKAQLAPLNLAYSVFDKTTTPYYSSVIQINNWIEYDFNSASRYVLYKYKLTGEVGGGFAYRITAFNISASNDGTTYTNLAVITGASVYDTNTYQSLISAISSGYKIFRVTVTGKAGDDRVVVGELELWMKLIN